MAKFNSTQWSVVLLAGGDGADAREALATLCRTYRPPVLAFIRARGYAADAIDDLAQEFFTQLIEHAWHVDADPARGRFRAFLLIALKRFLIDVEVQTRAQKRGGGFQFRSLEQDTTDPSGILADDDTPEVAFEQSWAATVIDSAKRRLRADPFGALRGLGLVSSRVTGFFQNGSLPVYAGVILATAAIAPFVAFATRWSAARAKK